MESNPEYETTIASAVIDTAPADLGPDAVNLARHIQALPPDGQYQIRVVKSSIRRSEFAFEIDKLETIRGAGR